MRSATAFCLRGRLEISLLLAVLTSGCVVPTAGGMGPGFVELYPVAEKTCNASLSGEVLGNTVNVHYAPALGEPTARRFLAGLAGLAGLQREREEDYAVLRSGLRAHLGDELFARVEDKSFLRPRTLETQWFLLAGAEPKALLWRGPQGSAFHFLPESPEGVYTEDQLRVRSRVKWEVHEITHWTIQYLIAGYVVREVDGVVPYSSSGHLPRWLEEGICDYTAMQFERWREKKWDASREIVARLAWDRPAVRANLSQWVDSAIDLRQAIREPEWRSDLMYPGSLGLVFAVESELGSGGLLELFKRLLAAGRQTDAGTIALIEDAVGKPLEEVGRVSVEIRARLLAGLLDRAAVACHGESDTGDAIPLAALGHFTEAADRTIPVLQELARCPVASIAAQGITGLSLAGRTEPLAATLAALARSASPELLAALEHDGSLPTARELARSASGAARWFRSESDGEGKSATLTRR